MSLIELAVSRRLWLRFRGRRGCWTSPFPWGLLLLLSPLIVLIAVGILLEGVLRPESKGPILLSEPRGSEREDLQNPQVPNHPDGCVPKDLQRTEIPSHQTDGRGARTPYDGRPLS